MISLEHFAVIAVDEYRFDVCFRTYHLFIGTIQVTADARNQKWFMHEVWFFVHGFYTQLQSSPRSAVLSLPYDIC